MLYLFPETKIVLTLGSESLRIPDSGAPWMQNFGGPLVESPCYIKGCLFDSFKACMHTTQTLSLSTTCNCDLEDQTAKHGLEDQMAEHGLEDQTDEPNMVLKTRWPNMVLKTRQMNQTWS